ncbi:hypothetical protein PQX77_019120 [Marasmius sp. AFHP31]|nr:hypothetical protein PQX77_019120 [Marasmius sp. AFHP31]
MKSHFLQGARNTRIGRKSVFQHVEGNVNHNYITGTTFQECEGDRVMPRQNRYREILEGDVCYREQTYSQEMEVVLRGASTTENSAGTRVKIVKRFYNATIYPNNNCPVTVVTFEPKGGGDKDITRLLWDNLYRSFSVRRSPWLAQALGLVRSEMPTFILHEELVNGSEFMSRYPEDEIVHFYLWYTQEVAMQALCADQTSTFPVSWLVKDWTFNPKTQSWHFDIASASIREWEDDIFSLNPIPLPRGSQPQLIADDIATHFEKTFGDVLHLYVPLRLAVREHLSYYASHGVLTFGAVVRWGGGIVAHFPSTPSPKSHFEDRSHNITTSYSTEVQQVSWLVKDWTFNPKTQSWHFDIASASIREWEDDIFSLNPIPLPRGSQPQLIADDIATHFEKTFGDVLHLYVPLRLAVREHLSYYASHGVLTFGAVVRWGGGIVAHFPSTPSPKSHFEDRSHNITTSYSTEVSSRVDIQMHNIHGARLNLYFSLRLPLKERYRLRAAYLSQHPSDADIFTCFIDEIGFSLVGNLSHTPSTTCSPAYLFVPPLRFECVNGMHCIRYPLPESLFYWAFDLRGRHVILENDWERYGIPELDVKMRIGSHWIDSDYKAVKQHLSSKKYGSNGKQYAVDHGYPELIYGNPHEERMEELSNSDGELEDSKEDKDFYPGTHLTSPSTFSLINAPSDPECTREEGLSITTCLANRLGLWNNTSASERKGKTKAVSWTDDTDGWDFVESDNS